MDAKLASNISLILILDLDCCSHKSDMKPSIMCKTNENKEEIQRKVDTEVFTDQ